MVRILSDEKNSLKQKFVGKQSDGQLLMNCTEVLQRRKVKILFEQRVKQRESLITTDNENITLQRSV